MCTREKWRKSTGTLDRSFPVCAAKPLLQKEKTANGGLFLLEQGTGVEPALTAWEAAVIPIYQPCERCYYNRSAGDLQPEILSKRMISAAPA